jgi:Flp pilus assembly protein TadG
MSMRRDERGSVTAEFAVVAPAVVLVVVLTASLLLASGRQVRLEQAAAQAARLAARGEAEVRVRDAARALVDGGRTAIAVDGDFVCVEVSVAHAVPLPLAPLRARSCALAGGL